ncbi:site-specific integrase [Streptomyces sp. NPDC007983]|uniref:site-specific integrase n=1 Tax=Streptomyces sp. NPDC007983 TaxID=3364800 RepID=UPI0036E6ACB1
MRPSAGVPGPSGLRPGRACPSRCPGGVRFAAPNPSARPYDSRTPVQVPAVRHSGFLEPTRLGLRRGEVLGLRWKDVDLTDGTITIRPTLQRVGGELLIAAPKTQRSARRVALPAECVTALRARRAQQHGDRLAAEDKWKDNGSDLVFTTKNGTPIEPRNLNRSFTLLCDKAGVRRVRFHDLRHTCASLLHEQGADARMIMEVLGHSSISVTMDIYTFVRLDSQRSAFDRVGDALRDISGGDDDDGPDGVPVPA